jgi:hypothetical protein
MATTGTDSGGSKSILTSDPEVSELLESLPRSPWPDDRWADRRGPGFWGVSDSVYREALTLGRHDNWEAGGAHRKQREGRDLSAREF